MPYIKITSNTQICEDARESIKSELGAAIEIFPGKSERWLMISFAGDTPMYFSGSDEPTCMVEVDVFGKVEGKYYDEMTAAISRIISEGLSISPERIYTKYREFDRWGCGDFNF